MENEKKFNGVKTVLLVFGIIFSVFFVPGLIFGIPVGGALIGLSSTVSREHIENIMEEAGVSEQLFEILMTELGKENPAEEGLRQEYWEDILQTSISRENIDEMIEGAIADIYNGNQLKVDVSSIAAGFQEGINEIVANGFRDLYAAWDEGTSSKYFSDEFVQEFCTEIENNLLNEYSEYGATSLEELETLYDNFYGIGAFAKRIDDTKAEVESHWNEVFTLDVDLKGMTDKIEVEINDAIYKATQNADVREAFDLLRIVGESSGMIKKIVYAIVIVVVLLLLVCYWFRTAGFVVPAVALMLGGGLCKLLAMSEVNVSEYIRQAIAAEPALAEVQSMITELVNGILTPFFAEVSKFGITMMGIAVLLILLAVLRGVVRKNMHVTE